VVSVNAIARLLILYLIELTIKIVALGDTRQPATVLLHRMVAPHRGDPDSRLVIFLLIGSPFVRGRRAKVRLRPTR
jgi:hypothetical protein